MRGTLEAAQELAANGVDDEAYAAFAEILEGPGSDRDHATAEIGAAHALWMLGRKGEGIALLEEAAKKRAGTPEEPRILHGLAEMLDSWKDEDRPRALYERAIAGYRRLAASASSPDEAVDAELGVAACLGKLGREDQALRHLEEFETKAPDPRAHARFRNARAKYLCAYWELGSPIPPSERQVEESERGLALYRSVTRDLPGTIEAAEARFGQGACLKRAGRVEEALQVYEAVAREQAGTNRGASALMLLGLYYARDDRDRAAVYYRRVAEEYPAEWRATRFARSSLEGLDRYVISPFYDKLMKRIQRDFLERLLHLREYGFLSISLALALAGYLTRLGTLAICLLLLAVLPRRVQAGHDEPLLRRRWTVRRLVTVMVLIWTGTLLLNIAVGTAFFSESYLPLGRITEFLVGASPLAVVCWRESPRALFAISLGSVLRVVRIVAVSALAIVLGRIVLGGVYSWLVSTGQTTPVTSLVPHGLDSSQPWGYAVPYYLFFALSEECLFRGAVLQAFKSRTSTWAACLLSSLLFAQDHLYPLWPFVSTFVIGVILVWVVEKTKSLSPGTALHAVLNLVLFALR
ncbi:MAG TPA: CPBP family glutamic-type intramembrane protease [Candidatus Polarisedimenticolaceae bacterium]|nr:CPBP family glutamic-type intramembrane protease [Candidatus Polarisedimenticolaceae bacterium]